MGQGLVQLVISGSTLSSGIYASILCGDKHHSAFGREKGSTEQNNIVVHCAHCVGNTVVITL